MRDLLARERSDERAAEAVALFCYGVTKAIGALAAVLGGVDTLVFAGGIGENAAPVRARIVRSLGHLGIRLDDARNDAGAAVVSPDGCACTVRVIRTDEEAIIARESQRVLALPDDDR
jgi:acetate kinase